MSPDSVKSIRINTIFRQLRPFLFLIGIVFFVGLTIRSWDETKNFLENIKWIPFFLSVLIGILDQVVASLFFQQLLKKYGMAVPYQAVGKMYFYGQMSKYIPGRFWAVLYQRSFVEMSGATVSLFFANVELLISFMIRNTIIGFSLILISIQMVFALIVYFVGAFGFVFVGRTDWVVRGLQWIGERLKRQIGSADRISFQPHYTLLFLYYIFATITFLSSNILMMYAAFGLKPADSFLYIAFLGIAWVIGALTIVVPAGFGVREIVFVGLANLAGVDASVEVLTSIAVVYRFWLVLQEIGGLFFAFSIVKIAKKHRFPFGEDQISSNNL